MFESALSIEKQYIYYENNASFIITPKLNETDTNKLKVHINNLNTSYVANLVAGAQAERMERSGNKFTQSYFWAYNDDENSIVVDNTTDNVENDIFNQFSTIAFWLYSKNYNLQGSFHCRQGNFIEYISTDGLNKMITHYVLFDVLKNSTLNKLPPELSLGEKILLDVDTKIKKYAKSFDKIAYQIAPCDQPATWRQGQKELTNRTQSSIKKQEKEILVACTQKRLNTVENNVKSLTKMNKLLWKVCTVLTVVSIGTVFVYMVFGSDSNNPSINNTFSPNICLQN